MKYYRPLLGLCYAIAGSLTLFEVIWIARAYSGGASFASLRAETVALGAILGPLLLIGFLLTHSLIGGGTGGSCFADRGSRRFLNHVLLGWLALSNTTATAALAVRLRPFVRSGAGPDGRPLCADFARVDSTCRTTSAVAFIGIIPVAFALLGILVVTKQHRDRARQPPSAAWSDRSSSSASSSASSDAKADAAFFARFRPASVAESGWSESPSAFSQFSQVSSLRPVLGRYAPPAPSPSLRAPAPARTRREGRDGPANGWGR